MKNSQRGSGHLFSLMVLGLIVWGVYELVHKHHKNPTSP